MPAAAPSWYDGGQLVFASVALLLAIRLVNPTAADASEEVATTVAAKIIFGAHDGTAQPTVRGHGFTGGGNIDVSQPAADTLVVTMTGAVAACTSALKNAEATLDFCQGLQFAVEFSEPNRGGKLVIQSKINGLLRAQGKHSLAGMTDATTTLLCGPSAIAVVPLAARIVPGGEAFAVTTSHGPVGVPVYAGHFQLQQRFRMTASQGLGLSRCKAIAEFSPTALPKDWIANSDPFHGANKEELGYQVIIQVIPNSVIAESTDATAAWPLPPPVCERLPGN